MSEVPEYTRGRLEALIQYLNEAVETAFDLTKMHVGHYDRLIVISGAALALSFTGATALRGSASAPYPLTHPKLLATAWLLLILSIVTSLMANYLSLAIIGSLTQRHIHGQFLMRMAGLKTAVDDFPELTAQIGQAEAQANALNAALDSEKEKSAMAIRVKVNRWAAIIAQVSVVAGFAMLALFFSVSLHSL